MGRFLWLLIATISALLLASVFLSTGVSTYPVGWEKSFTISPYTVAAKNIHMASRGNFIAIVFEGREKNTHRIYASVSFNGGKSFLPASVIANVAPDIEHHPYAAISGSGHIFIAWQNLVPDESNNRIFYSLSADMGATWSQPVRLFLLSDMELLPQVFYDDKNTLHLFYHGYSKNVFNLFHASSNDEKSFGKPVALFDADTLRGSFFPTICLSGRYIFIVCQGKGENLGILSDDLYFIKSSNYGKSFNSARRITKSPANDVAPSLAFYNDVLYCAYQNNEEKTWEIRMLQGLDFGSDWDASPVKVSTTNTNCYSPAIFNARNDDLMILWYDTRDVIPTVVARKYNINEKKFSLESILSQPKIPSRDPVAVSVDNRVIAVWDENGRVVAKFSDIYVDSPVVFSRTHPEDTWSDQPKAVIEWRAPEDESGIAGYAVIVNKIPDFIPQVQNVGSKVRNYEIPDIDDGVTYFHIRSIDGAGNYSRTLHYKIQVSRNPMPIPVVVSPTHPETETTKSRSPAFKWTVAEKERLKGFLFSLSKDKYKKPGQFTNEFETGFNNLEDGRYYFSIVAVDKTNNTSKPAIYMFVVNKADKLDEGMISRFMTDAEGGYKAAKKEEIKKAPEVRIVFPFDISKAYDKNTFNAILEVKNVQTDRVIGYSVLLDNKQLELPDKINLKNNIINVRDLKDGEYYMSVRAKYFYFYNGKKVFSWTNPVIKKFSVYQKEFLSPIVAYTEDVIQRLTRHSMPISVSLAGMMLSIAMLGYGSRLSFFTRLLRFRVVNIIRLIF